ncbi:MAG TPA: beta-ketoacyl-ACP synthase III [Bdellovibrionota bacterium]|nr:beta-ketoacyl-ACP synthase III [Bdellovibrionota bacterium]
MYSARVLGTGLGSPAKVLTNADLEKFVDTSDEWIRTRTGIHERRLIDRDAGETLTSISVMAAQDALKNSGVKASEIDLVVMGTTSPDTLMPGTATRVAGALGLNKIPALDINAACSGFMFSMHTVDALVRTGAYKKVLVIGGEHISSILNWKDRTTCVLFGDGAGAVVVEAVKDADPTKDSMILGSKIYTLFDEAKALEVLGGGSRYPSHHPEMGKTVHAHITMSGQDVFKAGSRAMAEAAKEVMEMCRITPDQIRWFVPHQANRRIIEMVAQLLHFPMDRVFVNIDRWANTSAGTIPICLAEMEQQKLMKRGDLILIDTFGGGFSYGAMLIRW